MVKNPPKLRTIREIISIYNSKTDDKLKKWLNGSAEYGYTTKRNEGILDQFEILGFDEIGYPDYLEYGKNNSKVVLSWWKFRMKRKSDGKLIILPIHYSHTFNNEGKIINSIAYYSSKHME